LSDREPIQLSSEGTFETSLSLGDPTLHEVLIWHLSKCATCQDGEKLAPAAFGHRSVNKCDEYYEIAAEYSEYEATYVRQGNP
jgi:hypothetical protein